MEFSDASCLPALRSRLRQLIPAGDGRIDAELVCTELVINAVEHAAAPRRVRVVLDAADLRIEVEDGSPDEPLTPGRRMNTPAVAQTATGGVDASDDPGVRRRGS